MKRLVSLGLAIAALAFAAAGAASGQSDRAVERSGQTFHVKACPEHGNPKEARCHAHIVTDAAGKPNAGTMPAGFSASTLQQAYGIVGASAGTPAIIAIVDAYGYANAAADLNTYRSTMGLPACGSGCFVKLNQRGVQGSYPRDDTGWAQETALDLDMVSAACPACKIVLVEADSPSFGNLAAAEQTAANYIKSHGAIGAISNSYGGGENGSLPYASAYNQPGIAITVSTGDSGYGVQFPASAPTVIAVGGTSLNKTTFAESAWSGAGSGCSTLYGKPGYQAGTATDCTMRGEADISAVADPNTGVAVYGPTGGKRSGWMVFGGTSASAPFIAGIFGAAGHTYTDNSSIYQALGDASKLHDVTTGSNGACTTRLCKAQVGWDGPTGVGTPKGLGAF